MKTQLYKYIIISFIIGIIIGGGLLYFFQSSENVDDNKVENSNAENEVEGQIWTCSMHPNIRMSEPGSCPICGMDLIPLEGESNFHGNHTNGVVFTEGEIIQNNVRIATVGNISSVNKIDLEGEIKINQNNTIIKSAHYDGRIEQLNVHYVGESVVKGKLLFKIYSPELVKAQKEFIGAVALKDEQPELYKAAYKKLESWKITLNQIKEIESSKEILEYASVYAEESGLITATGIEEGQYVKKGQTLFTIANLNSLWVEFDVYQKDLNALEVGQNINLIIAAKGYGNFNSKITYIDPVMNATKRTSKVRITIDNNGNLSPGMFVKGSVAVIKSENNTITIPKSAILWTGEKSVAYLEVDTNTFQMVELTLGNTYEDYVEVTKGLKLGDKIVVNGTFVVDASTQIQGKKSMMNTR